MPFTRDRIDLRTAGNFERSFRANRLPVAWFGEPSVTDRRPVVQSGPFVVPGRLDRMLDQVLDDYGAADTPLLVKHGLPLHLRAQATHMRYRMNVTNASLFPDLEGLARSTAYELEVIWQRLVDEYKARVVTDE